MGMERAAGSASVDLKAVRNGADAPGSDRIEAIDRARARQYGLLALLIARAPERGLLGQLAALPGDETPLGRAIAALARAAAGADADTLARVHFGLFIGVGRGVLLPHGSYYLTGFLHERPLAEVRADLAALGIERAGAVHEPEDHVAILCDVMAGLASGGFEGGLAAQRRFFQRHLEPWAGRFFDDLKAQATEPFYRAVGALGGIFIGLEAEAFALESGDAGQPDTRITPMHGGQRR
jgi:TorA maturation chaperone TorD